MRSGRKKSYVVFSVVLLIVLAILFLFPLYWIVTGSIKDKADILIKAGESVRWIPKKADLPSCIFSDRSAVFIRLFLLLHFFQIFSVFRFTCKKHILFIYQSHVTFCRIISFHTDTSITR